ncbi:reverse transcriptase-like protein, partial [Corynebacterium gottingense]
MKVSVFTDGGSRGNPGVAGSGAVVYGEGGETLAEIVYVVGSKSSNNVAEYHGLLRGLEAAAELGATEVAVSMDSKLVVEQMNGRWKIKHPDMQKLAVKARKLAGGFDRVTYTWVPRAKNKKADELSNKAMDAATKDGTPRIVEEASLHSGPPARATAPPKA